MLEVDIHTHAFKACLISSVESILPSALPPERQQGLDVSGCIPLLLCEAHLGIGDDSILCIH